MCNSEMDLGLEASKYKNLVDAGYFKTAVLKYPLFFSKNAINSS